MLLSHKVPVLAHPRDVLNHNSHGIQTKVADGRRPAKIAVIGGGRSATLGNINTVWTGTARNHRAGS